jgi:hypothetical protein
MFGERQVSHEAMCEACKLLGLPEPQPDSSYVMIEVRPFADPVSPKCPVEMTERRLRVTRVLPPPDFGVDITG